MNQTEQVIAKIETIEKDILEAKNEVKESRERLKRAIVEKEPTDVRANLQSLLESATAELAGLRKEKDSLIKDKAKLTYGGNEHEGNSRIHSDLTETFENMARINIQKNLYHLFHVGFQEDIVYV